MHGVVSGGASPYPEKRDRESNHPGQVHSDFNVFSQHSTMLEPHYLYIFALVRELSVAIKRLKCNE
jgi:hypothetical protein